MVLSMAIGLMSQQNLIDGTTTGLLGLTWSFSAPVKIGDTIHARLTCKQKTAKEDRVDPIPQGVVHWDVEVMNQDNEAVAIYTILTLVQRAVDAAA
jgi:oxepin-CoA hydrolase/3-oxo-5,6-dehydrosuberyl-CoA semialdehyde dehydrogenase